MIVVRFLLMPAGWALAVGMFLHIKIRMVLERLIHLIGIDVTDEIK